MKYKALTNLEIPDNTFFKLYEDIVPMPDSSVEYGTDNVRYFHKGGGQWVVQFKGDTQADKIFVPVQAFCPCKGDAKAVADLFEALAKTDVSSLVRLKKDRTALNDSLNKSELFEQVEQVTYMYYLVGANVTDVRKSFTSEAEFTAFMQEAKDAGTFEELATGVGVRYEPAEALGYVEAAEGECGVLIRKASGTVVDELSGTHIEIKEDGDNTGDSSINLTSSLTNTSQIVPDQSIGERNVYGHTIKTTRTILNDYGLIWLNDLQTYVHVLDTHVSPVRVSTDEQWKHYGRHLVEVQKSSDYFTCSKTGQFGSKNSKLKMHDGSDICREYFTRCCFKCNSCGKIFHKDDLAVHAMSNESVPNVCSTCYVPNFNDFINRYQATTSAAPFSVGLIDKDGVRCPDVPSKTDKSVYFGLELEYVTKTPDKAVQSLIGLVKNKCMLPCSDSSLLTSESTREGFSNSVELKSPPVHSKYVHEYVHEIFEHIDPEHLNAFSTCGMHVHVSKNALTTNQIDRLMSFIYHGGNKYFLEAVAGRPATSKFCRFDMAKHRRVSLSATGSKKVGKGKFQKTLNEYRHYVSEKYSALYTPDKPTIEFRLFSATNDKELVLARMEFLLAIIDYTRPGVMPEPKDASYVAFLQWLLDSKKSKRPYAHFINFLHKTGYSKVQVQLDKIQPPSLQAKKFYK